jgi:hypothetical protein
VRLASPFTLLAPATLIVACAPTLPPPSLDKAPPAATDQSNLLLFPESDAESLLGRAVQASEDGSFTIADARAPGCEVTVRREKAAFHTSRNIDTHSMTSIAAGYARFVAIEAKFGRTTKAEVSVDNTEVIRADMRGACGELVIDKVFVGHGKRSIAQTAAASGGVDVNAGVVNASPKFDTGQSVDRALEWKEDQAYGFTFTKNAKTEPLRVHVSLPSIVSEGEKVTARFESEKSAWLVVYYIDSQNHADVLWPSNEEPEPYVEPGKPIALPSPKEREAGIVIKAALAKPGVASRETLVVYAFADKRDFDAMKPATGAQSADGAAFAAELTKKLGGVPMSRWSNAVVGYVIEPRGK